MRFGILSTYNNPLLPNLIQELNEINLAKFFIILDERLDNEKDLLIFKKRTGNNFPEAVQHKFLHSFSEQNIPFYLVDNHNSQSALKLYKKLKIQCLFNAGTPRLINKNVIDSMSNGIINIHPGILPEYRGCSCVEWAILNDDPIGNTAHFMDVNYDTGPIIEIEKYDFKHSSEYIDIRTTVYLKGCKLAANVLKKIEILNLGFEKATKQDNKKANTWKPISPSKELEAIKKANNHLYKFQNKD
tara:strand:- start:1193 stop:1924 length:732 start_codon:yes stop_codon:yes gene_type:complete